MQKLSLPMNELRFAFRLLSRNRGLTAIITLLLGLGIGAVSASYGFFSTLLNRRLDYFEPDRLVGVWHQVPNFSGRTSFSAPNFLDWQAQNQVFSGMAAYSRDVVNMFDEAAGPTRVVRSAVSTGFFGLVGRRTLIGRTFQDEEWTPGKHHVAVLSHALWTQQFAGTTNIIGESIRLDGEPFTVVGVMPKFQGFDDPDLWIPLLLDPKQSRGTYAYGGIARLKPGVTLAEARANMDIISKRLEKQYPDNVGVRVLLSTMNQDRYGDMYHLVQYGSAITLTAVGMLLIIACMNIANLLLARHTSREKEIAIRTALGASRACIIRQLMIESLVLALLGGVLGLVLTEVGVRCLNTLVLNPAVNIDPIRLDSRVVWFVLGVTLATSILFGLLPAWQASRAQVLPSLKDGSQGTTLGAPRQRLKGVLVVLQVGLSALLLVGTGLLAQTFIHILTMHPGFETGRLLTLSLNVTGRDYPDGPSQSRFFETVREQLQRIPGVENVGLNSHLPLGSGDNSVYGFDIEGRLASPPGQRPAENFQLVSAGYFEALGVPSKRGRVVSPLDRPSSEPVVVINEAMVRKHWPEADPIGARINVAGAWRRVIGVVSDVRLFTLSWPPNPQMYFPHTQWPTRGLHVLIRTQNDPASLAPRVVEEIKRLDRRQPVTDVRAMTQVLHDTPDLSGYRILVSFMTVFAFLALFLACLGIYSMISFTVAQRTREFGIRLAVGAAVNDIITMVLRQGLKLAVVGIGLGLTVAAGLSRLIAVMLIGVKPNDLWVFGGVGLVLFSVAILGCYVPARRASRVDPLQALRYE